MALNPKHRIQTIAIHANWAFDPQTGALMPPVYLNTTYKQSYPGQPVAQYEYSRTANPTRDILESILATLEHGENGFTFASGSAALNTLLQTFPEGSHIISNDDIYGGTHRLFDNIFSHLGQTFSLSDLSDPTILDKLVTPKTTLIWIESPSNPLLKLTDIEAICAWRDKNAPKVLIAVDNTFATPILQSPLTLGADIVCHSTTKYIGGHSDVIGGALILKDKALAEKIAYYQNAVGAVPSPMDCYLLIRSIKTLPIRMQTHCANAMKVAEFLSNHPKIKKVIYPGLASHPQHSLAKKQMRFFGGMISAELNGDLKTVTSFFERLQLFSLAESLGGVESLIEHPALMTHAGIPAAHREEIGITDTLVRISVGIEDPDDLIEDLDQALGG